MAEEFGALLPIETIEITAGGDEIAYALRPLDRESPFRLIVDEALISRET